MFGAPKEPAAGMTTEDDPYNGFSDGRIKHLDMVQAAVSRLGGNGFFIKGWAVTVAGAFQGFGITRENAWLALAGGVPTCMFWFLDASFLRSERAFRLLFERIRIGEIEPFFMNATARDHLASLDESQRSSIAWPSTILRPSLVCFYAGLAGRGVPDGAVHPPRGLRSIEASPFSSCPRRSPTAPCYRGCNANGGGALRMRRRSGERGRPRNVLRTVGYRNRHRRGLYRRRVRRWVNDVTAARTRSRPSHS